jgi:hypothetical protein
MTRPTCSLTPTAQPEVILAASADLAGVAFSVRDFAVIMNERSGRKLLEVWMKTAPPPASLRSAPSSPASAPAKTPTPTASTSRWSSGAVEGYVGRTKVLKRRICRRASPDLHRCRVLLADQATQKRARETVPEPRFERREYWSPPSVRTIHAFVAESRE